MQGVLVALQESLLGASQTGQALSCAHAQPIKLPASLRVPRPPPPAISRWDMMNEGGSAKERLIFGVMVAGAGTR